MSLHMIFTIIQLLPLRTPSLENAAEAITEEGWTYWLYLLTSKGIYSILVSLILFCCLINAFQSKFGNKERDLDVNIDVTTWIDKFWKNISGQKLITCGPLKACGFAGFGVSSCTVEDEINESGNLVERVTTAEGELEALRNAFDLARKVETDLGDNVEEAEKEKDEIEGRSLVEKQWRNSELELARRDMESLQEQLLLLQQEKEEMLIKCQSLQEEAQKAGDALQKRQQIQEKLEQALNVVSVLKQAVADLEADRDEALESLGCLLPDLTITDESREKLAKLAFKNRNNPEYNLTRNACVEDLHMLGRGDDLPEQNDQNVAAQQWVNYSDQGYGEMIVSTWNNQDDNSDPEAETISAAASERSLKVEADDDEIEETLEKDECEVENKPVGVGNVFPLTSSIAFRQFFQQTFGQ